MLYIPVSPATELVMMIEPPVPWSMRVGMTALQVCQTPVRLMSMMSCQSPSVMRWTASFRKMPAFVRDDVDVAELGHPLVEGGLEAVVVAHVGLGGEDLATEPLDGAHRLREVCLGRSGVELPSRSQRPRRGRWR